MEQFTTVGASPKLGAWVIFILQINFMILYVYIFNFLIATVVPLTSRHQGYFTSLYLLQAVSATFQELSLEAHAQCGYDSVSLFDGPDPSSPPLGKYCNVNTGTIASTGPSMFVLFESDNSLNIGRFSLSWTFVNQSGQGRFVTSFIYQNTCVCRPCFYDGVGP